GLGRGQGRRDRRLGDHRRAAAGDAGGQPAAAAGEQAMTATVAAIQTAEVSLTPRADLVVRGAKGAHDRSDYLLVRVITSDDVVGYGEVSATPLWSGEDGVSARHFIETVLAPAIA